MRNKLLSALILTPKFQEMNWLQCDYVLAPSELSKIWFQVKQCQTKNTFFQGVIRGLKIQKVKKRNQVGCKGVKSNGIKCLHF